MNATAEPESEGHATQKDTKQAIDELGFTTVWNRWEVEEFKERIVIRTNANVQLSNKIGGKREY